MKPTLALIAVCFASGCVLSASGDLPWVKGDVNADGRVAPSDASLALDFALGIQNPTPREHWAADWDDDGTVEEADADSIFAHWLSGK